MRSFCGMPPFFLTELRVRAFFEAAVVGVWPSCCWLEYWFALLALLAFFAVKDVCTPCLEYADPSLSLVPIC